MKTFIALLLAVGVGFGAAYLYVSNQKDDQFKKYRAELEEKARAEHEKAEKELKLSRNRAPKIEQIQTTVEVPIAIKASPKEILDRLVKLKPAAGAARSQSIRQIVHQLENLADLAQESVPTIRAFMALNQDVEYERAVEANPAGGANVTITPGGARGGRGGGGPGGGGFGGGGPGGGPGGGGFGGGFGGPAPWQNALPQTDFLYPPSLRLGLISTLREIGGEPAEQALAEVLGSTGRGVEVGTVAKLLEDMAPKKYRDLALTAAKDLLTNPPNISDPSRLDQMSKSYLYAVLTTYNDTTFAGTAQAQMVSADGRLDQSALSYLTTTLKDQAMPALYQAYKDERLTNQWDKGSVLNSALNFAGTNPQANEMFKDVMGNEQNGFGRFGAVLSLVGGNFGPLQRDPPSDPNVIRGRMELLKSTPVTDERLGGIVDRTMQNLQNLLDGKPVDNNFGGFGGGGGGGGGGRPRGNRPGNQ